MPEAGILRSGASKQQEIGDSSAQKETKGQNEQLTSEAEKAECQMGWEAERGPREEH